MSEKNGLRWARRVQRELIRRLYTLDAKGIEDDELVNEAGYAMYARCESIRIVTEAHSGRVTCPMCQSIIVRSRWRKGELLDCECGWQVTWGEYHNSYRRKQLHGGKAYPFFTEFLESWPKARTYRDKLLAIDRVVHGVHGDLLHGFFRPAAVNLIECTLLEANAFLHELAYGELSTPGVVETRSTYESALAEIGARRRELEDRSG
jgi:predicted RNA-binding Zn-ribbon protein involved in translation (DUF1610 family)